MGLRTRTLLLLLLLSTGSCDIPGYIVIKNKSEGEAVYRYEVVDEHGSVQTRSIEFKDNRKQDEAHIMLGFGHLWTDERIREYLSTINRIEILSPTDTIVYTDKKAMFDLFRKSRRGVLKNVVRVVIH